MIEFFELFDFVNLDLTALTGASCDELVTYHVTFIVMSLSPVVVLVLLAYQFFHGRVQTALTVRKLQKDERQKNKALKKCYEELFQVVDVDKSGHLNALEVIDLLKLVGYHDTKGCVMTVHKAHQLIRLTSGSKYATEMTEDIFLQEMETGQLINHIDLIFSTHQSKKRSKKKKAKSMLHDGMDILAWNEKRKLVTTTFNIAMTVLLLLHTPVSKKVFQYFDCDIIGAGDWSKSFLRVDYSIPCMVGGSMLPSYALFLPIVLLVLSSFTIFLPAFLSYSLVHNRNDLYKPMIILRFGWLYDRMRRGAEYWEIVEIIRKMTLTGLIVFFPRNPTIRACCCVFVCVIFTAALNYQKPHKNPLVFWVEQICYIVALLIYVIAMVFEAGLDVKSAQLIGDLFIAIFGVMFVGFIVAIARTIFLVTRADHIELFGGNNADLLKVKRIGDMSGHVNRAMLLSEKIEQDDKVADERQRLKDMRPKVFEITKIKSKAKRKTMAHKKVETLFLTSSKEDGSNHVTSSTEHQAAIDDILGDLLTSPPPPPPPSSGTAIAAATTTPTTTMHATQEAEVKSEEPKHQDYKKTQVLLCRLDRDKFDNIVTKLSRNGQITPNRLSTLLVKLRAKDVDGLIACMLQHLTDDNGVTISEIQFRAYGTLHKEISASSLEPASVLSIDDILGE